MNKTKLFAISLGSLIFVVIAVVAGVTLYKSQAPAITLEETHLHAGFHIYRDNEKTDFTALKYMHLKPCTLDDHKQKLSELDPLELQLDKAHLHDGVGDVVHVHIKGATWQDLLLNLSQEIPADAKFFLNGDQVNGLLQKEIGQYDRVLILVGQNDNVADKIQKLPSQEKITEIEKESENCGV